MKAPLHIAKCCREEAANVIQAHRYLYHAMGLPVISDSAYDGLKRCTEAFGADVHGPTIYVAPGAQASLTDFLGAKEAPIYTEEQMLIAQRLLAAAES